MNVPDAGRQVSVAGHHIAKRFGHVQALVDANVTVHAGEVVALFGDNGAGKSTLLKILLGVYHADQGEIVINDQPAQFETIRAAQAHGIQCVQQDLALALDVSVIDNIFLGHEIMRRGILRLAGVVARGEMAAVADQALTEMSIKLPSLHIPVRDLSGGQRQAVAVARAVMWASTAVLLDEPTAALGARQSEIVCDLIQRVAQRGLGVLVVSHDIPRILKVADRVVILWRGRTVLDERADRLTVPDVVATMVGYQKETA
jgi:ABC-type sugar transport system ATPase subunit